MPVIGEIGPRSDGVDAAFWEGLAAGRLLIPWCGECERWVWPAAWHCPHCLTDSPRWKEISPLGTVFAWTRTWQPFAAEFAGLVPYLTVIVELPEVRLAGILLGEQDCDPRIGEPVEGVIQAPSELTGGAAVLRWRRVDV